MGHWQDEQAAIEGRFATTWSTTTAVRYANSKKEMALGTEFVAVDILPAGSEVASVGRPPLRRYRGVVQVTIFVPQGTGSKRVNTLAETAEGAFWDSTTGVGRQLASGSNGTITFETPPTRRPGNPEAGWHVVVMEFPFYRDQRGT